MKTLDTIKFEDKNLNLNVDYYDFVRSIKRSYSKKLQNYLELMSVAVIQD